MAQSPLAWKGLRALSYVLTVLSTISTISTIHYAVQYLGPFGVAVHDKSNIITDTQTGESFLIEDRHVLTLLEYGSSIFLACGMELWILFNVTVCLPLLHRIPKNRVNARQLMLALFIFDYGTLLVAYGLMVYCRKELVSLPSFARLYVSTGMEWLDKLAVELESKRVMVSFMGLWAYNFSVSSEKRAKMEALVAVEDIKLKADKDEEAAFPVDIKM